jgi:hypothetical protein
MKAVKPVIASNGVPDLQVRLVGSHSTSGREKGRNFDTSKFSKKYLKLHKRNEMKILRLFSHNGKWPLILQKYCSYLVSLINSHYMTSWSITLMHLYNFSLNM